MIESTPIIDFHAHAGSWNNRAFPDNPDIYLKQMTLLFTHYGLLSLMYLYA